MNPKKHKEVYEAVQFHPLFQGVEQSTALSLVHECEWQFYQKDEIILPRQGLWLILKGIADVCADSEVLEVVEKDELLGFSNLANSNSNSNFKGTDQKIEVRVVEAIEALFIPFSVLRKMNINDYLLTQVASRLKDVYRSLAEQVKMAEGFSDKDPFLMRVQEMMSENLAVVRLDTSVQEIGKRMSENRTSSVLVLEAGKLVGIMTERDLVQRVIANGRSLATTAGAVMSANPLTISRFAYYYEAISEMLLNGIKHLPVVEDGQLVGIVTLSDLIRKKNASVMKTIKRIEEAEEIELPKVKEAIYQITDNLMKEKVPAFNVLELVTGLYDRLVVRVVELAVENLGETERKFAFFQMGSSGRGEQFMLTDQDHFLVYEDGGDPVYFNKLGIEITRLLEVAGYARCQGLMMASEEQWRGTVSQWQERVRHWMLQATNDHLLLAQNFFAYRFVAGEIEIARELEKKVSQLLERSKIFLYRLVQAEREQRPIPVLDQPLRSLFKIDRKSMDVKKEILFPYHHSLQILSLLHGILVGTPVEKIEKLQQRGVLSEAFIGDIKIAVDQILSLYMKLRWSNGSASVLHFSTLSTREKDELVLSVKTLRELQSMVFARFQI